VRLSASLCNVRLSASLCNVRLSAQLRPGGGTGHRQGATERRPSPADLDGKAGRDRQHPPAALEQALQRLGRNIRTARLRRRWRLEDVAERMGVSRFTVADVERGKPGTSIAAYLGALWVLGLLDQLEAVADPDRDGEGKALEAARQPGQAPRRHRFDDDF
jgi:ribosome-binding protein aMBF1 (putative translation factor)